MNPGFDVPDYSKLDDGGLHWMYVSPAEGKAWSYYDYINPAQPKHQVAGLSQATFGWQELTGGDYKTTLFELHREKDGNVCADVHGSRTIGQTIDTQAGVAYTVSIRHSGRSKGNAGSVQVLVGPDKDHLRPLEMSRMNVSRTGAKYGDRIGKVGTVVTTHSDSVDSTEGDHPRGTIPTIGRRIPARMSQPAARPCSPTVASTRTATPSPVPTRPPTP